MLSFFKRFSTPLRLASGSVGVALLLLAGFFAIRGTHPARAELAFSTQAPGDDTGLSVIPASCESSPPTNHFTGDCTPVVNLGSGPNATTRESNFLNFQMGVSSTDVAYGSPFTLTWYTGGATTCTASGAWSGSRNIGSGSATDYNSSPSGGFSIYTLTCTNGVKTITRAKRVYFEPPYQPPSDTGNGA